MKPWVQNGTAAEGSLPPPCPAALTPTAHAIKFSLMQKPRVPTEGLRSARLTQKQCSQPLTHSSPVLRGKGQEVTCVPLVLWALFQARSSLHAKPPLRRALESRSSDRGASLGFETANSMLRATRVSGGVRTPTQEVGLQSPHTHLCWLRHTPSRGGVHSDLRGTYGWTLLLLETPQRAPCLALSKHLNTTARLATEETRQLRAAESRGHRTAQEKTISG